MLCGAHHEEEIMIERRVATPRHAFGICLLLLANLAIAGADQDVSDAEEARYAALIAQDSAALSAILADEFVYHQANGNVQNKPGYVKLVTGGEVKVKRAERYDIVTHVYGDTATVTGSTRVDVEMKGEARQVDLRFLNVWVKRDGRWQIVARQAAYKTPPK
jgi:ketosteroid isomerase-like protein